ncbi:unnamed protein product [Schistocephalus solidus]|uniref:Uncharacterized protein n=1 Tax=Schistocephalus solidus TaxID=70667 RepID=A0A183TAH2_SCHSO|nr:unnamed protein product [Schistocephalus solidus]
MVTACQESSLRCLLESVIGSPVPPTASAGAADFGLQRCVGGGSIGRPPYAILCASTSAAIFPLIFPSCANHSTSLPHRRHRPQSPKLLATAPGWDKVNIPVFIAGNDRKQKAEEFKACDAATAAPLPRPPVGLQG